MILGAKYLNLSDCNRISSNLNETLGNYAAKVMRMVLKNQNKRKRLARDHFKETGKIEV